MKGKNVVTVGVNERRFPPAVTSKTIDVFHHVTVIDGYHSVRFAAGLVRQLNESKLYPASIFALQSVDRQGVHISDIGRMCQ